MINLYKLDLKRIFKDKLFLIACIIGFVLAIFTPLTYQLLFGAMMGMDQELSQLLSINSKLLFFSAFAPGNNLGLIAPILLAIALCKDFSFGTVRNKVIGGKTRTQIFLSMFLSCTTVMCILIFLHAFITLAFSLFFFEYQATPFEAKDLGYFFASLGLELLVYVFISAMLSFLCVFMKNAGVASAIYIALNLILTIAGSIVSAAKMFVDPTKEMLSKFLNFLDRANVFAGTYIGVGDTYEWSGLLAVLIFTVGGTALFLALGMLTFQKKDLK